MGGADWWTGESDWWAGDDSGDGVIDLGTKPGVVSEPVRRTANEDGSVLRTGVAGLESELVLCMAAARTTGLGANGGLLPDLDRWLALLELLLIDSTREPVDCDVVLQ